MENYYTQGADHKGDDISPRGKKRYWILGIMGILGILFIIIIYHMSRPIFTPHIDVLEITGTISSTEPGMFESGYSQSFILQTIDDLTADEQNRGLVLYIDSPGGGVYETDEVYLKLMEYKEVTGRPIYVSFGSQAASGGYYIAMSGDKIYSNRNCITGSIGVRLSNMIDMSGLLEKLGIQVETITSGENKAMGDPYSPLTQEQRDIFQEYVNESYEQFVEIVVNGRPNLSEEQVRTLADGRIYTAKQARENGLIDEIGTLEDAVAGIQEAFDLYDCAVYYHSSGQENSWWHSIFSGIKSMRQENELETAKKILQEVQNRNGYYGGF